MRLSHYTGLGTKRLIPAVLHEAPFQHQHFKQLFLWCKRDANVLAPQLLPSRVKCSNNKRHRKPEIVCPVILKMTSSCKQAPRPSKEFLSSIRYVGAGDCIASTPVETAITIETKDITMETQDTLYCYVRTAVGRHYSES